MCLPLALGWSLMKAARRCGLIERSDWFYSSISYHKFANVPAKEGCRINRRRRLIVGADPGIRHLTTATYAYAKPALETHPWPFAGPSRPDTAHWASQQMRRIYGSFLGAAEFHCDGVSIRRQRASSPGQQRGIVDPPRGACFGLGMQCSWPSRSA